MRRHGNPSQRESTHERCEITPAGALGSNPRRRKDRGTLAEDGVVELPFLHSVGIEPRYKGRTAIAGFYDVVKRLYPDLVFEPEDMHVLIETPDQVFA